MNDLENFFWNTKGRVIHKYTHYLEIYERHFSKFRNKSPVVVEVGIGHGGSLQMWKSYFGAGAQIHGIDIVERRFIQEEQIEIWVGDQSNLNFWDEFFKVVPQIDIFIDDGSHFSKDQIITLEKVFPYISKEGVYLCEDLHTAYWESFNGGYKDKNSFIEYAKEIADTINSSVIPEIKDNVKQFDNVRSLLFYSGVVVIEKGDISRTGECLYMGEEKV